MCVNVLHSTLNLNPFYWCLKFLSKQFRDNLWGFYLNCFMISISNEGMQWMLGPGGCQRDQTPGCQKRLNEVQGRILYTTWVNKEWLVVTSRAPNVLQWKWGRRRCLGSLAEIFHWIATLKLLLWSVREKCWGKQIKNKSKYYIIYENYNSLN